jgi:subfamily B ATP-binding cassette protein MsbA
MVINRVSGLALPASAKFLIDDVIGKRRAELLLPLVATVLLATLIQGVTSFALTQLLSKAAQRLIAELRRKVQEHVGRLPVAYYDSNKTGALVSRIMNDVEGVRNLIGTGLVEFLGGLLTASIALVVLIRISAAMTSMTIALMLVWHLWHWAFGVIVHLSQRTKILLRSWRLTKSLAGVNVARVSCGTARALLFSKGRQLLTVHAYPRPCP